MQIFALKIPSTATAITLLPPLLPPLNHMIIRYLTSKVTVVAVKITKYIVRELHNNAYPKVIRTGYPKIIRTGYPKVIRTGHSVTK